MTHHPENSRTPVVYKGIFMYVGSDQPHLKGMKFRRLASPYEWVGQEEWQKDENYDLAFAESLDRHLQHEAHGKYLSTVEYGGMGDLNAVEVSEKPGEVGGFLFQSSKADFEKNFKKIGKS